MNPLAIAIGVGLGAALLVKARGGSATGPKAPFDVRDGVRYWSPSMASDIRRTLGDSTAQPGAFARVWDINLGKAGPRALDQVLDIQRRGNVALSSTNLLSSDQKRMIAEALPAEVKGFANASQVDERGVGIAVLPKL